MEDTQELSLKDILQILAKSKKSSKKKNTSHKLLPLLLDIVGEKQCMDILRIFAGEGVYFPTIKSLNEACSILFIWKEVNKIDVKERRKRGEKIKYLSERFNCDAKKLYKIGKGIL